MSEGAQRAANWPIVAALLLIAGALYFNIIAARECPSVYGLSKSRDTQGEPAQNQRPAPATTVPHQPADQLGNGPNDEGCYTGPFGIPADGWVALFTLALTVSTIGLWITTEIAARRADVASFRQVLEARRIGEAQVRAYIAIETAQVEFVEDFFWQPSLTITIKNHGQSPARKFVWNPTIRYLSGIHRRSRSLMPQSPIDQWATTKTISALQTIPDSNLFGEMAPQDFAKITGGARFIIHVRVAFAYLDVFDRKIEDEAFFIGLVDNAWRNGRIPGPEWVAGINPSHRPKDWDQPDTA